MMAFTLAPLLEGKAFNIDLLAENSSEAANAKISTCPSEQPKTNLAGSKENEAICMLVVERQLPPSILRGLDDANVRGQLVVGLQLSVGQMKQPQRSTAGMEIVHESLALKGVIILVEHLCDH